MHANGFLTIFQECFTYVFFLEKCQKTICMHDYSLIHVDRSLRVSNLGDKYVPYFKEKKGPLHVDWRTTMHENVFQVYYVC